MALAIYGKHPAKGDFLEAGVPPALRAGLEGWLDASLAAAREALGPDWPQVWAQAPTLCFWIGEAAFGEVVAGVMVPTQDRVGRRFPLVALATGADAPPPPVAGAGGWHASAAQHLAGCLSWPGFDQPSALLAGLTPAEGAGSVASADFWAVRPGADVDALWADVTVTDHRHAAAARSFWWVAGDAPAPEAPPVNPPPEDAGDAPPEAAEAAAAPEPVADTGQPVWESAEDAPLWDLPSDPQPADDSPFGEPAGGLGLFAAPEVGAPSDEPAATVVAMAPPPAPPPPRWSQVWAGAGLPSGQVLAWFFRGHAGNV